MAHMALMAPKRAQEERKGPETCAFSRSKSETFHKKYFPGIVCLLAFVLPNSGMSLAPDRRQLFLFAEQQRHSRHNCLELLVSLHGNTN